MRVNIHGDIFEGTPEAIVRAMREKTWEEGETLEEYMQRVARRVQRFGGEELVIKGATEEERCRDFLRQLANLGIAEIEGGIP